MSLRTLWAVLVLLSALPARADVAPAPATSSAAAVANPAAPAAPAAASTVATAAQAATTLPPSPPLVIPAGAESGPNFDAERATRAWLDTLSGERRARSDAYFEGGYWIQLWNTLLTVAIALIVLFTGVSRKMRELAVRLSRFRFVQTMLYAFQFILVTAVLSFPFTVYVSYTREKSYGLLNQGFGAWFGEQLIGLLVTLVMFGLLLPILYAVIRRTPRTWWAWGTLVMAAFIFVTSMLAPVFLSPLFNDYKPLPESAIRENILSLAHASGVPADDVYWYDASKQSDRVTANVSGFWKTTRISLADNLLKRTPVEGVEHVMAHEMGHYLLGHTVTLVIQLCLLFLVGFLFVAWGFGRLTQRFAGWGIESIADPAGLPVIMILFSVFGLLATPVQNTIIRTGEVQADIFGLNAGQQPDGFAVSAIQLGEYRKLEPGPVEELIFYDHPSGYNRVHMAMVWKGEQLKRAARAAKAAVPTAGAPAAGAVPADATASGAEPK